MVRICVGRGVEEVKQGSRSHAAYPAIVPPYISYVYAQLLHLTFTYTSADSRRRLRWVSMFVRNISPTLTIGPGYEICLA